MFIRREVFVIGGEYCMSNDDIGINKKNILNASKQTANTELGIIQEYNSQNRQSIWDDEKAKDAYRDKIFGEKKTVIDENGNVLHRSHNAAKKKYHMKDENGNNVSTEWKKHAAEVDHKVSLKSLHESAKHNPFLKDSDLKEIANSECNYNIISKRENSSKGAKNSADILTHAELHKKFAFSTAKNVKEDFTAAAKNSIANSKRAIIIESIEGLVLEGKSVEETLKDSAKAVVVTGAVGGAEKLLIDATTHFFVNSGNEVLQSIVQQNAVGQVLTLGVAVGKSLVRYVDGEIDEKELAGEIELNGSIILVSTVVSVAIPVPLIGPLVSFVATNVAKTLYETNKHMEDYLIHEKQIKKIEREAIKLMEEKREQFKLAVNKEFEHWDSTVSDGFYQLLNSSLEDSFSIDGMVSGLDKILSLCGTQATFHSVEEYVDQLDQPLTLCF